MSALLSLHPSMMNAIQGAALIARQMAQLLQQIPEPAYIKPLPLLHNSTIGQHFRHILEFYACLIDGYQDAYVSYAGRLREAEPGLSPVVAQTRLLRLMKALESLDLGKIIQVESEFSDAPAEDGAPVAYPSSMGRELQYAFDHAIHHLAIIRLGLEQYFPDISIPPNLGVAPSTLKHLQKTGSTPPKPDIPETNYG